MVRSFTDLLSMESLGLKVFPIGPYLWEAEQSPPSDLKKFLIDDNHSNVIYLQIGRLFQSANLLHDFSLNFGRADYKILLDTHRMDFAESVAHANFFVSPLPHSDVLISTGMSSAYLAALQYGVPILSVSSGGSGTDVVSESILEAGIGIVLPTKNCTPKNLAKAVNFLLTHERIRGRVREFSSRYQQYNVAAQLAKVPQLAHLF